MKQRIAVLALFSFLVSVAAAPLAWGAWPLWPKEGLLASATEPATVRIAQSGAPTVVQVIDEPVVEEAVPPAGEATAPAAVRSAEAPPAEPAADAAQAGEDEGEKVAAGFFSGSKGKWAAFGAAAVAVAIIAAGGGSSTSSHH